MSRVSGVLEATQDHVSQRREMSCVPDAADGVRSGL